MSTTLKIRPTIETSEKAPLVRAKNWDSPTFSNLGNQKKRLELRLEIKSSPSVKSKVRMSRHYLLQEDKSLTAGEALALKEKRQHYRSLFESVSNR